MQTSWTRRGRAERIVGTARLVLAVSSLTAVYLDPSDPAKYAALAYSILVGYAIYSCVLLVVIRRSLAWSRLFGVATHAIDLLLFSTILYFTSGPSSPFFVHFVFAIFAAALRFGRSGVLWTSVLAVAVYLLIALPVIAQTTGSFELNRFVIRCVYLVIVGALLVYLTRYQEDLRDDLARLAAGPGEGPADLDSLIGRLLRHAASVSGAPRTALAWEEHEDPVRRFAELKGDQISFATSEWSQESSVFMDNSASPFLAIGETIHPIRTTPRDDGATVTTARQALAQLQGQRSRTAVAVPMRTRTITGWLFCLDKKIVTHDDIEIAIVLARLSGALIDAQFMAAERERSAVVADRVRLGRELHDGLLQSLSGAVHSLEVVHRTLESDPADARRMITTVQAFLMEDQRALRLFVQDLAPLGFRGDRPLSRLLDELATRAGRQWSLEIELTAVMVDDLPLNLREEIYFLVSEAVFNVIKHAEATRITIDVRGRGNAVDLTVVDDGHGFSFTGTKELDVLEKSRSGPASICSRVRMLGGELRAISSTGGATLQMTLPVHAEASQS